MLSGQSAFAGESTIEKLGSIQNDEPEPLRDLAPTVPEAMAELVHRCLEKDASDRPQSIAEVLIVLREMAT